MPTSSSQSSHSWSGAAKMTLAWGILVLILSGISVYSNFQRIGKWTVGTFTTWAKGNQCLEVNPLTPSNWPGIDKGVLQVGDCILAINGHAINDMNTAYRVATFLATQVDENGQPWLRVKVKHGETIFEAATPAMLLTPRRLFEQLWVVLISGLSLWGLGLVVLLAQPNAEANRVWAAFLFMGELVLVGALTGIEDDFYRWIYDYVIILGPRPFLGALLIHLAMLFPEPVRNPLWRKLRFAGYPPALAVNLMIAWHKFLTIRHLPGGQRLDDWTISATTLVFGAGVIVLLMRAAWVALHSSNRQYVYQARFLILAWLLALPMSFFEMILRSLHIFWFVSRTSNLTFMFWVVPAASLIAYAMLRYQAFAYRGVALNVLVVVFASAFFTQMYATIASPRGLDGVQFVVLFGAVLLTSFFWFSDSPVRRRFRRLFVRHEFDYEITDAFSHALAKASSLDECVEVAAPALCEGLDLAWAAIWLQARPDVIYLARAGAKTMELLPKEGRDPSLLFPTEPTYTQHLDPGVQEIGMMWVGDRTTAEVFDDRDQQLLELLAQALARSLAIFQQVDALAEIPAQILRAVEAERQRIGRDLHDGVLQFLSAIPLEMDRAAMWLHRQPDKALSVLERSAERAGTISVETRAIVHDLYPPFITQGGLLSQAKRYATQGCATHEIGLVWRVEGEGWARLPIDQAIHVYRIFQQAVTNAWTHAQATKLWVTFYEESDTLIMMVMDDGRGLSEDKVELKGHLGLVTMRQRARAILAELEIISELGWGTVVHLKLSRPQETDDSSQQWRGSAEAGIVLG